MTCRRLLLGPLVSPTGDTEVEDTATYFAKAMTNTTVLHLKQDKRKSLLRAQSC